MNSWADGFTMGLFKEVESFKAYPRAFHGSVT